MKNVDSKDLTIALYCAVDDNDVAQVKKVLREIKALSQEKTSDTTHKQKRKSSLEKTSLQGKSDTKSTLQKMHAQSTSERQCRKKSNEKHPRSQLKKMHLQSKSDRILRFAESADHIDAAHGEERETVLHKAVYRNQIDIAKALIKNGASLNTSDHNGIRPLHVATSKGHVELTKMLINKGAKIDSQTNKGTTPLHLAVYHGQLRTMELLLQANKKQSKKNKNKKHSLLDLYNEDCFTPMHIAAHCGNIEAMRILRQHGVSVKHGFTHQTHHRRSKKERSRFTTPMHLAALHGHFKAVQWLHKEGASNNATNSFGLTPLHSAIRYGDIQMIQYLLEQGANPNAIDKRGFTPLHHAVDHGSPEVIKLLIAWKASIHTNPDPRRWTPLHFAATKGRLEAVRILLQNGASVVMLDRKGATPLELATRRGHVEIMERLINTDPTAICIRTQKNLTLLDVALLEGHTEASRLLAQHGASISQNCIKEIQAMAPAKKKLAYSSDATSQEELNSAEMPTPRKKRHPVSILRFSKKKGSEIRPSPSSEKQGGSLIVHPTRHKGSVKFAIPKRHKL